MSETIMPIRPGGGIRRQLKLSAAILIIIVGTGAAFVYFYPWWAVAYVPGFERPFAMVVERSSWTLPPILSGRIDRGDFDSSAVISSVRHISRSEDSSEQRIAFEIIVASDLLLRNVDEIIHPSEWESHILRTEEAGFCTERIAVRTAMYFSKSPEAKVLCEKLQIENPWPGYDIHQRK